MVIEDFVKKALAQRGISIKDAAEALGYKEQSFRNKLSRRSLNLHDIILLSLLLGQKLAIIDDRYQPQENEFVPDYIFDYSDYLSQEEFARVKELNEKWSNRKLDSNWFMLLPTELKLEMMSGLKPFDKGELEQMWEEKLQEGVSYYVSSNFRYSIEIRGKDHEAARAWLEKNANGASAEEEVINCITCDKFFDVLLRYNTPYA